MEENINHDELTFEYNKIDNNIFIGTNMCCHMHFEKELLDKGVAADISLEKDKLDSPFGVEFYTWVPVEDRSAPTQDQIEFTVSVIDKLISMNKKVYIHCQRGHGRAPTMVAAYFISKGDTVEKAMERIKKERPVIHLDDVQIESLRKFESEIK